jgi:hypothetical protein
MEIKEVVFAERERPFLSQQKGRNTIATHAATQKCPCSSTVRSE